LAIDISTLITHKLIQASLQSNRQSFLIFNAGHTTNESGPHLGRVEDHELLPAMPSLKQKTPAYNALRDLKL
jgi:hypothetical protein